METTMTLADFLLARLAEDEADAKAMPFEPNWTSHPEETGQPIKAGRARIATCAESVMAHIARHDPARVLAECEAQRRLLALHEPVPYWGLDRYGRWLPREGEPKRWYCECQSDDGMIQDTEPCETKRILGSIWSDHPDFNPEWRP